MSTKCEIEALKSIKSNRSEKFKKIQKIMSDMKRNTVESRAKAVAQAERFEHNSNIVKQFEAVNGDAVRAIDTRLSHYTNGITQDGNLHTAVSAELNSILPKFTGDLNKVELEAFETGKFDLEIEAIAQGKTDGIKISELGRKLHKKVMDTMDEILKRKQDVKFSVKKRKGYLGRQYQDPSIVAKMAANDYATLIKEHFDFGGASEAYVDELAGKLHGFFADQNSTYFGIGKELDATGKKFEFARDLKFKSPEAAVAFRKKMGDKTIFQNIIADMRRDTKEIAAARMFGPNYRQGFNDLVQEGLKYAQSQGDKQALRFESQMGRFERYFESDVLGSRYTGEGVVANTTRKIRQFTDIKLLGESMLTTFSDLAFSSGVISSTFGKNFFSMQANVMKTQFGLLANRAERMKLAADMGVHMEDILFDLVGGRAENIGHGNGMWDRGHRWFMEKTLLPAQSAAARIGNAKLSAMSVAMDAHKSFDQLYAGTRERFKNFGISPSDWEILRNSVMELDDGTKIVMNVGIEGDTAKIRALKTRYSAFLSEISNTGSPTPGVKQHSMKSTLDPNSVNGAIMNFFMQYKSFVFSMPKTISAIAKTGAAERGAVGLAAYNYKEMAGTISAAMAFGATSLVLKDIAKGRKIREFDSVEGVADIIAQTGLGLMYFDMLSTDYSKGFRSISKDVAGPAYGTFDDFGQLLAGVIRGKAGAKEMLNAIERNTPSIPFTKGIINRNVFEIFHEQMNTGRKKKPNSINDFLGIDLGLE